MKPPRSLLNIEIFEDRLLPSTFAIGGFDPIATSPTNPSHVSIWHQQDTTASDSWREENFVSWSATNPNSSSDSQDQATNPNSSSDSQDQATGSEETAFSTLSANLNSVSFSQGRPLQSGQDSSSGTESSATTPNNAFINSRASSNNLVSGEASSPQPFQGGASTPQSFQGGASSPQPFTGFGGNGSYRFFDFQNAADSPDGRWSPWFNHDNQTYGVNPPDGTNDPGPPSSDSTGDNSDDSDNSDNGSTPDNPLAPLEVAAPTSPPQSDPASAPSTPEQYLASISPQSNGGQSTISEQLAPTEQHILAEITLAAVSLMGSQAALSIPTLPTVVNAYPSFTTELPLPSATVDRTTLRVKAPAPILVKEVVETTESPPPIEIQAPTGAPVVGAVGLDVVELNQRVSRVLASMSNLSAELTEKLEQPEAYAWLVAAGLLSFGAGYVMWINQKSQRVVGFPLGRGSLGAWEGEEYDARNR